MKAVVLEERKKLSLREFPIEERMGPHDVRIAVATVGICGSDLHYYEYGAIGDFVVREPMILGHEASGIVTETGSEVKDLKAGDRVCMEPGIPDPQSRASRLGLYNVDPAVKFWATPPVHGVLRPHVVHPAAFTFKLPDSVSLAEGALAEPAAVGVHAVNKARIKPGDVALVIGAGTIGLVTALAALAGGCSRVLITDVLAPKLELATRLGPITPINAKAEDPGERVMRETGGWGADVVFEASGNGKAAANAVRYVCPGGCLVFIGIPHEPVPFDVAAAQVREARVETVFRYAHVYPRVVALMASGKLDVKPLISRTFPFEKSIQAFEYAANADSDVVKVQIEVNGS